VDRHDAFHGNPSPNEIPGVGAGEADVGQFSHGHARRGEELILGHDFDAEEIRVRRAQRDIEQEQALAEADFDLDGMVVAEDRAPIEQRREQARPGFLN